MILLIISVLLFVGYAGLIIYYRKSWLEVPVEDAGQEHKDLPFISVIIPARNEEENISDCILSIFGNDYPRTLFEIIVANDFSTDKTVEIVEGLAQDNLHVISLSDHISVPLNSYKKKAIEVSITKANGELIVTTDADCIVPSAWLKYHCFLL